MIRFFSAVLVLLLAVGVTQSGDNAGKKVEEQPQFTSGVIRSLEVKEGAGSLTILVLKSRQDNEVKFAEQKFAITKDTRFFWGASMGPGGRPGRQGRPVDPGEVAAGFYKFRFLWITFTGEGEKLTATEVNGTP